MGKGYGAEVLRWWVASSDFTRDMSVGGDWPPVCACAHAARAHARACAHARELHIRTQVGSTVLEQSREAHRKIRNTCRFMLGNMYDFRPGADSVPLDKLRKVSSCDLRL